MPEVEDEEFQPFIAFEIVGDDDGGMHAGHDEAGAVLDGPERVGLCDRAGGFERFGDDPVDQRIDPQTFVSRPAQEVGAETPARGDFERQGAQLVAIVLDQLAGK